MGASVVGAFLFSGQQNGAPVFHLTIWRRRPRIKGLGAQVTRAFHKWQVGKTGTGGLATWLGLPEEPRLGVAV
jgi:hypothetical protein